MKQQLSKIFADENVNEVFTALGYISTDKAAIEKHLAGVHGHEVQTITREDFEKMEDGEAKPKLTLEDKLARLDSKGIQAMIEKHSENVKKKTDAVNKLTAQGNKMDANKFQVAKEAQEKAVEELNQMNDALTLRLEEEKAQELKDKAAKQ